MELRDFAERVLFATTLEEKLRCPADVTDEHPGAALAAPPAPGRPVELKFKAHDSARAGFPGLHQFEEEGERGDCCTSLPIMNCWPSSAEPASPFTYGPTSLRGRFCLPWQPD